MNDFVVKNGIQLGGSFKGNASDVTLGTGTYNLEVASYDGVSLNTSATTFISYEVAFNEDGTKLYFCGASFERIYQYSLSTAFDITSATYDSISFSISSFDNQPYGLAFNNNGTKFYLLGNQTDTIYQFSMTTAFDMSSASYDSVSYSVTAQDTSPFGLMFNNDGTKFYVLGRGTDIVYQYSMSTAFDINTASYDSISLDVSAQASGPSAFRFNSDGSKLYVGGTNSDTVFQYSLSSPFDLSSASYDSISFSVAAQQDQLRTILFNNSGTKMFLFGTIPNTLFQYSTGTSAALDLSTADAFEVTPTADVTLGFRYAPAAGNAKSFSVALTGADVGTPYDLANASYDGVSFSVAGQLTNPSGVFFKPDGTVMYVIERANDRIYQYALNPAWDISTASYTQLIDITPTSPIPTDVFFKPDGTKMYVSDQSVDAVNEYALSTAWDVSTASYTQNFSVAAQESSPQDLFFKPDGTQMYVLGGNGDDVNEYSLSTAWDVSTASYTQNFSVAAQDTSPTGIFFKPDGLKVYVVGESNDNVYDYSLSTAWDISTASYVQNFSVAAQDAQPQGVFFKSDGVKMYIVGQSTNTIYQYSTGTAPAPATITYPSSVVWSGGTAPTTPADGVTDLLTFYTEDGGNTYYGFKVGEAMA